MSYIQRWIVILVVAIVWSKGWHFIGRDAPMWLSIIFGFVLQQNIFRGVKYGE